MDQAPSKLVVDPGNIQSRRRPPCGPSQATEWLFRALEQHAPDALRELRDSGQPTTDWARRYRLDVAEVHRFADGLREWWRKYPRLAAQLSTRYRTTLVAMTRVPRHDDYLDDTPWAPYWDESYREYIARVGAHFRELRSLRPHNRAGKAAKGETYELYAEWTVKHYALGLSLKQIADQRAKGDDSTVSKGIKRFAAECGLLSLKKP